MTDSDTDRLTPTEVAPLLPAGFRHILNHLHARYRTADFASALALVNAVGAAAEERNHHPDIDLRWGRVDIRLSSHDVGGITARDLALATEIDRLAADAGATAAPAGLQDLELGLDTWAADEVRPFWAAILGYRSSDDVADPMGRGPALWFQDTDRHETPRQRFHLDVWVSPDEAEQRVRAALDAGGTLADDSEAPSFWVLADAQGNRACVCTVASR